MGNKGGHPFGYKHSEETKRKISKALIGKKRDQSVKDKISNTLMGVPKSEETKNKISSSKGGENCSYETRRKISTALKGKFKGDKSPLWKGGITPVNNAIRTSTNYSEWRTSVFKRDGYTCKMCNDNIGGKLNAHHITSFSYLMGYYNITTFEEALNCEALWDLNNGITLCKKCHKSVHSKNNIKTGDLYDF
jgi:hypothetical protein